MYRIDDANGIKDKTDKFQLSNNEDEIPKETKPIIKRTITEWLEIIILFGFVIISIIYFLLKLIEESIPACCKSITFG
jgi:hypothetical protein